MDLIAAYPKTGSTWLRLVVGNVITNLEKDPGDWVPLDFHTVNHLVPDRFSKKNEGARVVKSHWKWGRVDGDRVIHLIRHPMDTMISLFHYWNSMNDKRYMTLRDIIYNRRFGIDGNIIAGIEGYIEHTNTYTEVEVPLIRVSYEELRKHPDLYFGNVVEFILNKPAPLDLLDWSIKRGSFDEMRKSEKAIGRGEGNPEFLFTRNGRVGQWEGIIEPIDQDYIMQLIRSRCKVLHKYYGSFSL